MLDLFIFDSPDTVTAWSAIDDRVMGGVSASTFRFDPAGHAVFSGVVSPENNGGFASVRAPVSVATHNTATAVHLEVKGDGKRYKLNVRTDETFDGVNYQIAFEMPAHRWESASLDVSDFKPTFRGRLVADAPPLDPTRIRQVGLMIADRQWGPFALAIRSIRLAGSKTPN
jgi:NADH dehydrogenase [ubiquinone] 1 alpha subcomplex assembly factor 1